MVYRAQDIRKAGAGHLLVGAIDIPDQRIFPCGVEQQDGRFQPQRLLQHAAANHDGRAQAGYHRVEVVRVDLQDTEVGPEKWQLRRKQ